MVFPILNLTAELVSHIVDQIDDAEAFRSLSQTCSQFQALAEPKLYETVFRTRTGLVPRLLNAINSKPYRAKSIRSIETRCRSGDLTELNDLATIIGKSSNLENLILESPYCNSCYGQAEPLWQDVLPRLLHDLGHFSKLTTLTIHWSERDERYWLVTPGMRGIFSHLTLKHLTMSCAALHGAELKRLKETPAKSTSLTSLTLIECEITLSALETILSLPKALSHLSLGQNAYHTWTGINISSSPHHEFLTRDPEKLFAALGQQKHSLQSLNYVEDGRCSTGMLPNGCNGFIGFDRLTELFVEESSLFMRQAICDERTAPPRLTSLHVESASMRRHSRVDSVPDIPDYHKEADWILQAAATIESLETVAIITQGNFDSLTEQDKSAIAGLRKSFQDRGAQFHLISTRNRGAIPPILYGERAPGKKVVYVPEDTEPAAGGHSNPGTLNSEESEESNDDEDGALVEMEHDF